MENSGRLNSAQSKRFVVGIALAVAFLTAACVWWGLSHPTPASLQVLEPSRTPMGPALVQATITVNGMSCEGCAASIRSALTKKGADEVEVDLELKRAKVIFRSDKLSLTNILETIVELGYEPKLDS
jgi:copper chaperone CopZ